jgi:hypothetical protein
MISRLYYCVLKNYSGKFNKKSKGNTHLFFLPLSPVETAYVGLLGEVLESNSDILQYACQLMVKLPEEIVAETILHQTSYFKERYQIVEEISCEAGKIQPGKYFIHILDKGAFVRSDLTLTYQMEYSTTSRRIYFLEGDLNFLTGEVDPSKDMAMVAYKQKAILGRVK